MPRTSALALLALLAAPLTAQTVRPVPPTPPTPPTVRVAPRALTLATTNPNAARLGVTLGETSAADTLGVLVDDVNTVGPAAKAGLKKGDRIQAVNGVNLKLDPSDADDDTLEGMMQRRLQREMAKAKPGDDISLRVLSGSAARNVTVKAVAERELTSAATVPRAGQSWTWSPSTATKDRAALGVQLGGSPSKRDTLGVLVIAVNGDGPAERSGIIEGDRIARINGVDLRVPAVDAGDAELSRARVTRLQNELSKLEPGTVATLTVVTAGRSREVRVTTAKSSELGGTATYFFNDGQLDMLRELPAMIEGIRMPAIRARVDGPRVELRALEPEIRRKVETELQRSQETMQRSLEATKRSEEVMQRSHEAMKRAQETLERARVTTVRRVIVV
jgi:serine protease Do